MPHWSRRGCGPAADFAFRYPHELSGGQRQRVVIAGALVMDPEVIVADEPVSMLDVSIRTELLRLMLDLRAERGLTYLFITHDLSLAWVIADRIAVMYLGKIMEIGPAESVIRSPHNPYTQALVSVSPSPEPPTTGTARQAHDPRRRDARCRTCPGRLPVQPALPVRVRPMPRRGAAAVRRRWRPVGCVLAGRGWSGFAGPAVAGRSGGRDSFDMTSPSSPDALLEPAALARLLAASAASLEEEMRALGEDSRWHPAPGEWCANEVLGHILEAEARGFNGRIRTMLAETDPALVGWDQVGVATARADCERDPLGLLAEFLALRDDSLALIRSLEPADLERSATHDRVGRLTIADVLAEWVHHDRNHLRQMLANSQARVWPQMGNARRFSAPDG